MEKEPNRYSGVKMQKNLSEKLTNGAQQQT